MTTEMERMKDALGLLTDRMGHCINARAAWPDREMIEVLKTVDAILNPAPIMEEVEEIVGWVNVYQRADGSLYASDTYKTEHDANWCNTSGRISCQPIRVTVKREKKRPVEKSTRIILHEDGTWGYTAGGYPFKTESTAGTFTWHEDPTT